MMKNLLITLCVLLCLYFPMNGQSVDWRNVESGSEIYSNTYIDQPYVLQLSDGSWLCVFTTGAETESRPGQHIVAIKSYDKGKSWSMPVKIEQNIGPISSWAIPYRTSYGRIYVFYNYNGDNVSEVRGKKIRQAGLLGWYCYKYSDDNGQTWSKDRFRIPIRLTAADIFNEFNGKVQMFWGIDKPHYLNGNVLFMFSKLGEFVQGQGEGWLLLSDNLDIERNPNRINWKMLPEGEYGVRNSNFESVQEEHNSVILSDGSIYCVYRTALGFLANSISRNSGRTWSNPDTLRYSNGFPIKNPRACPRLFKCKNGKYLLWFHNHSGKDFKGRTPVWLSGGIEKEGTIVWSQPEILLYTHEKGVVGMSYPDLIEDNGKYWITETQKSIARTHEINPSLLEGLWDQDSMEVDVRKNICSQLKDVHRENLVVKLPGDISESGMTLEMKFSLKDTESDIILINGVKDGRLIKVNLLLGGALDITVSDGVNNYHWITEKGIIRANRKHHVFFVIDCLSQTLSVIIDGRLCDGGMEKQYGWEKFNVKLADVGQSLKLSIASTENVHFDLLQFYNRYLTVSECVSLSNIIND